jgi:hypothetical protein
MHTTNTQEMEWEPTPNSRKGTVFKKVVREGEVSPAVGYYARASKFAAGEEKFEAPRHKHDFDQLRIGIRGKADFGRGIRLSPGDICYFPAGAPYGPERFDDVEFFQVQWGQRWVTKEAHDEAIRELAELGEFRNGLYRRSSPTGKVRQVDSLTAIYEHVNGIPPVIPKPRYAQPILIRPGAFTWTSIGDGLSVKRLGNFTEDELRLSLLHWDGPAPYQLETERTSLIFTTADGVEDLPSATVLWSDLGAADSLSGGPGAEALLVEYPAHRSTKTAAA